MQTLFLTATKRCKPLVASLPSDSPSERPLNMHTLDILSQVLFVGLMAMLLYVLYLRFVRMLSRDRIQGTYAQVADCTWHSDGRLVVVIEMKEAGWCQLKWEGGEAQIQCASGRHEESVEAPHKPAGNVEFTFENQVIRRKVD
jgi:hypothetical protein